MSAETLNILSLWPEQLWRTKQSPSRRFYTRALGEHREVNLHQSGPGFEDWDNAASGMENIRRLMPQCHAVLSYKALGGCEKGCVNDPAEVAEHCLTIETFNECWAGTTEQYGGVMHPGGGTVVEECRKGHIRLVVIHHENDRERVGVLESEGARVVHIPHCAHPMFLQHAKPWKERSGVVLTGSDNAEHYPLRRRWENLLRSGKIDGRRHYRPGNYTRSIAESDMRVEEYAKILGSCRVKLGCSSVWKYGLQHFTEAALAGAAHVSDMPDATQYDGMVYAVDPEASDYELTVAVRDALERSEELGRRAQEVAKGFTTAHYADRLVSAIRESL